MTRRPVKLLAGLAILGLVSAGCGVGRDDGGDGQTGAGVTSEPCPKAVNQDNGCIYLGTISDLTSGPFAALAVPITDAQKAFWKRVNQQGGIGGYDIDVTRYVRDNKYNPETHNQVYQEIKGDVLGLAQTLGSPTTAAIINDLESNKVVAAPASWTSAWAFQDVILESGTNYCFEAMNSVDYGVEQRKAKSVMAVHYAGDYGEDAAAGARIAANKQGVRFEAVETEEGQDNQAGAIEAVASKKPDLLILTTGPTDAAVIVGQAAARGYRGMVIGTSPTWNPGLLASPAAEALKAMYLQSGPWAPFGSDTPGHRAMRKALGKVEPNDGYTSGWVWSYPLKAALEKATQNGNLTREGLLEAVQSLREVDYEGMLPKEAGNFSGSPNQTTFRQSLISKPDESAPSGVTLQEDFFVGSTAKGHNFDKPCFE
ncbi:MAG: ABC transporter substrate-binding protein [Pseudonocardiaceae bacterium]|nr:ABC transporter substrate-binding protein [Pseudonocardiaceae bacterium]